MSIEVMSAVWNRYPVGGGQLLVALALADEANVHGCNVFPSVARIAARAKLQARSVQRIMGQMVASGWLQVVHVSSGRRGDTNHYRISPEWLAGGECIAPAADVVRATLPKSPKAPTKGAKAAPFADGFDAQHMPATGDILSPVPPVDNPVQNPPTGDILSPVRVTPRCLTGDLGVTQPGITPIPNTKTPLPPKGGQTDSNSQNRQTGTTPPQHPAAIASAHAPGTHPGFESFKAAYPRWRSEGLARREWNSLKPSPEMQRTLLAALAEQARCDEWQREAGRFIPKPSVWLARECWADDVQSRTTAPPHQSATPLPAPVVLSPKQMAANRKRAGELLAQTRAALAARELQGVGPARELRGASA